MSKENIIFLDYDGVVNTIIWDKEGKKADYNHPSDNAVNDFQAVQWLSEFCQKYDYSIVVTSTWARKANYKECLINGGLRTGIEILGCIDVYKFDRPEGIADYLKNHPEIKSYIIIDDEYEDKMPKEHFVKCDDVVGFKFNEFYLAEKLHKLQNTP